MEDAIASEWQQKLVLKVESLLRQGYSTLPEILPYCEGAQPKDIEPIFNDLINKELTVSSSDFSYKNRFFFNLPAANPLYYQWWYTLESQELISQRIIEQHPEANTLCLGTPTIAAALSSQKAKVHLLDIDEDLIGLFNSIYFSDEYNSTGIVYNVLEDIDESLIKKFDAAIIDPPWYTNFFNLFLSRTIEMVKDNGVVYCSIPQVLTRPGIESERKELIDDLLKQGHELVFIEKSTMKYIVPSFEESVFKSEHDSIINQPWRSSDLLAIRVKNTNTLPHSTENIESIRSFSRKNSESTFRVFLSEKNIDTGIFIKEIPEFKNSISKRDNVSEVNLWTSDRCGFQVDDYAFCETILEEWSSNKSKEEAISLISGDINEPIVNKINLIEKYLELWSKHSDGPIRRTDEEIKEKNQAVYSSWAEKPSIRENQTSNDGFRIEFQRDRDRIIWSNSFRKLSDKTQLFPLDEDEHLRQRLAHSIEVMQLASTIASSFGLNKDLVEAGALAHDIGHTPFGHAGENAIDRVLKSLKITCGFNHYEHGVDVVRYLEGSYQNNIYKSHAGLNLTPEVCDCILKHTYCHIDSDLSHENVWKNSKHQKFLCCSGFSHLEGQAVRAADKISYLLSDIEDGIKLGAIKPIDLISCRMFHRPPIDFRMREGESLYKKFIEQRGSIIRLLMEDIILESSKRISKLSSRKEVHEAGHYCIFHSPQIESDMDEIWDKIQVKRLHSDPRVLSANMRASKIVSEMLLLLILFPEHINEDFRIEHEKLNSTDYMKFYNKYGSGSSINQVVVPKELLSFLPLDVMIGFNIKEDKYVDIYDVILAKDYVASLTDKKITKMYNSILSR